MAKTIFKTKILDGFYGEYPYNVQVLSSVDGGNTFWYCGNGRFCKTEQEAKDYAQKVISGEV